MFKIYFLCSAKVVYLSGVNLCSQCVKNMQLKVYVNCSLALPAPVRVKLVCFSADRLFKGRIYFVIMVTEVSCLKRLFLKVLRNVI